MIKHAIPKPFQDLFKRVNDPNFNSPTQAIRALCYECMGFENIPESVITCTAPQCPLFHYRPDYGCRSDLELTDDERHQMAIKMGVMRGMVGVTPQNQKSDGVASVIHCQKTNPFDD